MSVGKGGPDMTLTRSQVLAGRGYPPEVVAGTNGTNGNGHSRAGGAAAPGGPGRTCTVCAGPIDPRRPLNTTVCGAKECAAEHRRRRAQPAGDRRAPAEVRGAEVTAPSTDLLRVLADAGLAVTLSVTVGGDTWYLTRGAP
jgi:hypothetical protein